MKPETARDWPWGIIWFLMLIFVAWPISFISIFFYVLLLPFVACEEALKEPTEQLIYLMKLPKICSKNMVALRPMCGSVEEEESSLEDVVVEKPRTHQKTKEEEEHSEEEP